MKPPASTGIRVICRFRPKNKLETDMNAENVVEIVENNIASISDPGGKAYRFDFDHVFGMESTQEEVSLSLQLQ